MPFHGVKFYSLVYMSCLIFFGRLKCRETELKELSVMAGHLHQLFGHRRLKGKCRILGLRAKLIVGELHTLLVVEVEGRVHKS
jgi:hypothetical protein